MDNYYSYISLFFKTNYRRITRFRVKHEGASLRGLRIFANRHSTRFN